MGHLEHLILQLSWIIEEEHHDSILGEDVRTLANAISDPNLKEWGSGLCEWEKRYETSLWDIRGKWKQRSPDLGIN